MTWTAQCGRRWGNRYNDWSACRNWPPHVRGLYIKIDVSGIIVFKTNWELERERERDSLTYNLPARNPAFHRVDIKCNKGSKWRHLACPDVRASPEGFSLFLRNEARKNRLPNLEPHLLFASLINPPCWNEYTYARSLAAGLCNRRGSLDHKIIV